MYKLPREITYLDFDKLVFPLYPIPPSVDLYMEDGLLKVGDHIVDDTNMPGQTLGLRRLMSPHPKFRLNKPVLNPTDLSERYNTNRYITSTGKYIKYVRKKTVKIKSYLIKTVTKNETYSLIRLYGHEVSFKVPRPPPPGYDFCTCVCTKDGPAGIIEYTKFSVEERTKRI